MLSGGGQLTRRTVALPAIGGGAAALSDADAATNGLSTAAVERLHRILLVYSLGLYDVMKAVRTAQTKSATARATATAAADEKSSVPASGSGVNVSEAQIWKMFIHLLNQCTTKGSGFEMQLAAVERTDRAESKLLAQKRDAILQSLLRDERTLKTRAAELVTEIERVRAAREAAEAERSALSAALREQHTKRVKADEFQSKLESKLNHWKLKADQLKAAYERDCETERKSNARLRALKDERTELLTSLDARKRETARLDERVTVAAAAALKASVQRAGVTHSFQAIDTQRTAAHAANTALDHTIQALTERQTRLNARAAEQIKAKAGINSVIERLTAERTEQESAEKAAAAEIAALQEKHTKWSGKLIVLRGYESNFNTELTALRTELSGLHAFVRDHDSLLATTTQRQSAARVEAAHLTQRVAVAKAEQQTLSEEFTRAQTRNTTLTQSIMRTRAEWQQLTSATTAMTTAGFALRRDKQNALAEHQIIAQQLSAVNALYDSQEAKHAAAVEPVKTEISTLEQTLAEHARAEKVATENMTRIQAEMNELDRTHSDRVRELADSRERLMRTTGLTDTLNEQLTAARAAHTNHTSTVESLETYLREIETNMQQIKHSVLTADQTLESKQAQYANSLVTYSKQVGTITAARESANVTRNQTVAHNRQEVTAAKRRLEAVRRTLQNEQDSARTIIDARDRDVTAAQTIAQTERERAIKAEYVNAAATNQLMNAQTKRTNASDRLNDRKSHRDKIQAQIQTSLAAVENGKSTLASETLAKAESARVSDAMRSEQKLLESEVIRLRERIAVMELNRIRVSKNHSAQTGPSTLVPPPPAVSTNMNSTSREATNTATGAGGGGGRTGSGARPAGITIAASTGPVNTAADAYAQTPLWLLHDFDADDASEAGGSPMNRAGGRRSSVASAAAVDDDSDDLSPRGKRGSFR